MPFVAMCNGERIISIDISEDKWKQMKEDKNSIYTLPCCGSEAILKTIYRTGTQFFAHKNIPDHCNFIGESEEHLRLKGQIYKFFKVIEERVCDVEHRVDGGICDVYVERDDIKYSFEVQLSSITIEKMRERNIIYKQNGLLPIWLIKKMYKHEDCFSLLYHEGLICFTIEDVIGKILFETKINENLLYRLYNYKKWILKYYPKNYKKAYLERVRALHQE